MIDTLLEVFTPIVLLDLGIFGITLEILQTPKNSELELKKLSTGYMIFLGLNVEFVWGDLV